MLRQLLIFLAGPFIIAVTLPGLLWPQANTLPVQATATVQPITTPQAEEQNEPDSNTESYQFVLARQLGAQAQLELATQTRSWQREDGLRLDRIMLTRDRSYSPGGNGPTGRERLNSFNN